MTTDTDGVIYSPESDQNKNKIKNNKNEKKKKEARYMQDTLGESRGNFVSYL